MATTSGTPMPQKRLTQNTATRRKGGRHGARPPTRTCPVYAPCNRQRVMQQVRQWAAATVLPSESQGRLGGDDGGSQARA